MELAQGSLVVIDGKDLFWKGQKVEATSFVVRNDAGVVTVAVTVPETPAVLEMQAAGIKIRRG